MCIEVKKAFQNGLVVDEEDGIGNFPCGRPCYSFFQRCDLSVKRGTGGTPAEGVMPGGLMVGCEGI